MSRPSTRRRRRRQYLPDAVWELVTDFLLWRELEALTTVCTETHAVRARWLDLGFADRQCAPSDHVARLVNLSATRSAHINSQLNLIPDFGPSLRSLNVWLSAGCGPQCRLDSVASTLCELELDMLGDVGALDCPNLPNLKRLEINLQDVPTPRELCAKLLARCPSLSQLDFYHHSMSKELISEISSHASLRHVKLPHVHLACYDALLARLRDRTLETLDLIGIYPHSLSLFPCTQAQQQLLGNADWFTVQLSGPELKVDIVEYKPISRFDAVAQLALELRLEQVELDPSATDFTRALTLPTDELKLQGYFQGANADSSCLGPCHAKLRRLTLFNWTCDLADFMTHSPRLCEIQLHNCKLTNLDCIGSQPTGRCIVLRNCYEADDKTRINKRIHF